MIKVNGQCILAADPSGSYHYYREYLLPEGPACRQTRIYNCESDYLNGKEYRDSPDNGRTWGEWITLEESSFTTMYGEDERIIFEMGEVWNPVYRHFVSSRFTRFFLGGHKNAYDTYWNKGEPGFLDHQRVCIRRPGELTPCTDQLVCYEEGTDFDSANPRNPEHLFKNNAYANPITILQNGDIAIPLGAPVDVGCRIAGLDVNQVFPSCPAIHHCVLVARGHFRPETNSYTFTFSNPIILGDLRSSRGIDEPVLTQLKSGRLLLVMRGSNVHRDAWRTRIEKGTPSYKWYAWSDDGGLTFTSPEPWHFDDREIIYSSATISRFLRSEKNGKLYWIGNITDHRAYGNFPRFPLQIVEIDEETGLARKESLTIIDTRREGESEQLQLSNFHVVEDRETGHFEVTLCKLGQFEGKNPFCAESWQYDIDLGE